MKTKLFLLICIGFVWVGGCGKQSEKLSAITGIDLPCAPSSKLMDPSTIRPFITIGANSRLLYDGSLVSKSDLKNELRRHYKRQGSYEVNLVADKSLPMKEVWEYITLGREEVGIWRYSLIAIVDDAPEVPMLGEISVATPIPEGCTKYTGPVMMQVWQDSILTIMAINDAVVLNGRRVSLETLTKQLGRLASYSKQMSLVILFTDDAIYQELIDVLNVCAEKGLNNLSIMEADAWFEWLE